MIGLALLSGVSERANGQAPIATRKLAIESKGGLNETQQAGTVDTAQRLAANTVSAECREQFKTAKAERDEARAKDPTVGPLRSFGCHFKWLRLTTNAQATEYFGDLDVGKALALTSGDQQNTLYTELLSDNLWTVGTLGYARVGLSTQIAGESGSDKQPDAGAPAGDTTGGSTVQQLFQGGGNAILHFTVPWYVFINFLGESDVDQTPLRRFDSFVTLALGLDIPELNAAVRSQSGNARLGLQGVFTQRTFGENFRFFLQGNTAYVVGFNGGFYENLQTMESKAPGWGLLLVRGTAGVEVARVARIGASLGATTLAGVKQKPRLTIQLVSGK